MHRRDIEEYLSINRKKFVGFRLEDDLQSMAGLPQSILEGRSILDKVGSCVGYNWDSASRLGMWTSGNIACFTLWQLGQLLIQAGTNLLLPFFGPHNLIFEVRTHFKGLGTKYGRLSATVGRLVNS